MVSINSKQKKFAINFILYFFTFIFIIIIGISKVYADTYTNLAELRDVTVVLISNDNSNSPVNVAPNSDVTFTYVTEVSYLLNNYSFAANTHYQLESHLAKQQFTNANHYSVQGANGEQCLITYNVPDTILNNDAYPRWSFQCPHATSSITISINNSNGEYLWSNTPTSPNYNIYQWTTALLKVSDTSMSGSGTDADNIINNQNQNTQDIINNQDSNTQDIINNQNKNTQDIINSNRVCSIIDSESIFTNRRYLNNVGSATSAYTWGITDYIQVLNSDVRILAEQSSANAHACFYDGNKTLLSCIPNSSLVLNSDITLPTNTYYARFSIMNTNNVPKFILCKNGSQALTDSLTDDDIGDSTKDAADFITDFDTETFGLTSIVTAPLNLIQSLTSSSCTSLHLPLPYLNNKYLDLPCMTTIYQNYFGAFFTMYQTITYGIIAYWVIVRIFNQVKDFKNPEHDEIEVVDL